MAYIGNFPVSTGFKSANFKALANTQVTHSMSGRTVRSSLGTLLFQCTLQFPSMTQAEWRSIQAFVTRCNGALNEFDIVIPTVSASQSTFASSLVATVDSDSANANLQGDTSILINTNISSNTALKAGDIVRFANHTKVYMVTTDINTNATGEAVLNIEPALIEDLSDGEAITTNNVPMRATLINDIQEFQYRTDNLVDYEIDIQEVL